MCLCGRYQYVLSHLNMEVSWHWCYLMSAHSSMAASIDLPTLKVLGTCHAGFCFSVICTCWHPQKHLYQWQGEEGKWGEFCLLLLKLSIYTRGDGKWDLCPSLWSSVALCVGVNVFHATLTWISLTVFVCMWNNGTLKKKRFLNNCVSSRSLAMHTQSTSPSSWASSLISIFSVMSWQ